MGELAINLITSADKIKKKKKNDSNVMDYCKDSSFGRDRIWVNNQEIGHIHGNKLIDFPFPFQLRKVLVAEGRVSLHHIFPTVVGGVSYWIKGVDDDNRPSE